MTWTTASAQINYEVTNATNSYFKVFINYIDDNNQGQVFQATVGTSPAVFEIMDGVEMTQVTIKTTGGTVIANSNENYYHATGCSGWPGGVGYMDVAPTLANGFCVQWGNEGPSGCGCQINYRY